MEEKIYLLIEGEEEEKSKKRKNAQNRKRGGGRGTIKNEGERRGERNEKRKEGYWVDNKQKLKEKFQGKLEEEIVEQVYFECEKDMQKASKKLRELCGEKEEDFEETVKSKKGTNFTIEEVVGDLFANSTQNDSLAHCVSSDLKMGKGIAVLFKNKFKRVEELSKQNRKIGENAILEQNGRFIFYMITKKLYWNKPTLENLSSCLQRMKQTCLEKGIKTVCMPRIGCGLDGLDWKNVKQRIVETFEETDLLIRIFRLE